jgi:hypothetical protein
LISPLTQQHYEMVLSYLERDRLNNIYLIHSLHTRGLVGEDTAFWGAVKDEQLTGILHVGDSSASRAGYIAGQDHETLSRLGQLAYRSGAVTLVGKRSYVQPAAAYLGTRIYVNERHLNFYRADPDQFVRHYDYPVRIATEQDIPSLVALYRGYEFASKSRTDVEIERAIERAMEESGVYFVYEPKGRIVSAARVFPQTADAGMIGAARTLPEFRGRGIYLSVRTACFEYLFSQGKTGLGMFVDTNDSMHRVLKKQGGSIISEWLIVDFKTKPPLRRRILPSRLRHWGLRFRDRILGR